jgi:hypothetical protein
MIRLSINNELERVRRELVVALFEILLRCLPGETEENIAKLQSG